MIAVARTRVVVDLSKAEYEELEQAMVTIIENNGDNISRTMAAVDVTRSMRKVCQNLTFYVDGACHVGLYANKESPIVRKVKEAIEEAIKYPTP